MINETLYIDIGENHGLKNRQIGIIKKLSKWFEDKFRYNCFVYFWNYCKWSKLVPLMIKLDTELDGMKIQFIE